MENRQGTLISIGALTIAGLCFFYSQFRKDRSQYKQKKTLLETRCQQIISKHNKIDYQAIKESGKKQLVFYPMVREYTLREDTYKRFIRASWTHEMVRPHEEFKEDESGGRFQFKDRVNDQEVTVEINNCNIQEATIRKTWRKNIIFPENETKTAQTYNYTFEMKAGQALALYGTIGWSITENRFILQPQFILNAWSDPYNVVQRLRSFWQAKIEVTTLHKMILAFSMMSVAYLLIYRPAKSIWNRLNNKYGEVNKQKLKLFGEKKEFSARLESNLDCEKCKKNSVNIIYDCGHLCLCQGCHTENVNRLCPVCNKVSANSIKIFL